MQPKKHARPLERTESQPAILPSPLISNDPQTAARVAELLRLGIVPDSPDTPNIQRKNVGGIPVNELRLHCGHYLADMELCNKSATIAAKKAAYEKLFWFLESQGFDVCGEREIRAFLSYVKNSHLHPDGRWGRAVATDAERARFVRPATSRTVEYYFIYIRTFYRWLAECELIERDPTTKIKIDKPHKPLIEPFSAEQVKALREAAKASALPERNEALIVLGFDTGLRAAEICNMSLKDLDFKPSNGIIRVIGKGDKPRIVPFGKDSLKAMRAYMRTMPKRAGLKLWTSRYGRNAGDALNPNGLLQLYGRLGKAAGITGVRCSPHTMRHTFAINYLRRSNGDVTTLQILMGHEKIETTMRYLHIVEADIVGNHQRYSPADGMDW